MYNNPYQQPPTYRPPQQNQGGQQMPGQQYNPQQQPGGGQQIPGFHQGQDGTYQQNWKNPYASQQNHSYANYYQGGGGGGNSNMQQQQMMGTDSQEFGDYYGQYGQMPNVGMGGGGYRPDKWSGGGQWDKPSHPYLPVGKTDWYHRPDKWSGGGGDGRPPDWSPNQWAEYQARKPRPPMFPANRPAPGSPGDLARQQAMFEYQQRLAEWKAGAPTGGGYGGGGGYNPGGGYGGGGYTKKNSPLQRELEEDRIRNQHRRKEEWLEGRGAVNRVPLPSGGGYGSGRQPQNIKKTKMTSGDWARRDALMDAQNQRRVDAANQGILLDDYGRPAYKFPSF